MTEVEGRVYAITGAARGLGRAYAADLLKRGARVVLNDLEPDDVRAAARALDPSGARVAWIAGSAAADDVAAGLVSTALDEFGRLDGLVNNAGIRPEGLSWDEPAPVTRRAVEVNLLGTILCGAAALRHFVSVGHGAVVNVSSRAQTGIARSATYSATKGAVASLTYSWSLDVPARVRVNAIAPQARGTGTRRAGSTARDEEPEPAATAPLVAYLLSDASAALNGQVVRLVGTTSGLALGLMDHPRDGRLLPSPEGWSFDAIARAFDGPLSGELVPVGAPPRPVLPTSRP